MLNSELLSRYQKELKSSTIIEILNFLFNNFNDHEIGFATSLGAEDQVLTDLLLNRNKKLDIFTLDTGRLFESTYKVIQDVKEKYGKNIDILFPDTKDLKELVKLSGPNLFYDSLENRKECCRVRKLEPLKKKLLTKKIWITGLRKDQSVTRLSSEVIEWDESFGLFKISPLLNWSESQVWDYIRKNDIPYNSLHDQGFPSIGCEPCTRAVELGEDIRSGRWWWENPQNRECGLHIRNGKILPGRS